MRRLIAVAVSLVAGQAVYAQNVGIGTTAPAARLDVKTTSNYVGQFNGASPMYIGLFEGDVYRGYIGSYSGAAEDVDIGTGAGNVTGKVHLAIQSSPRLTVNSSGQVGIGTTNPAHLFHVNGGDLFVESSSGKIILGYEVGGSQWRMGTTGAGADIRWYTWNGTTETPKHYFQQNGYVGINTGIPVPIAQLEVVSIGTTSSTNVFALRASSGDTIMRVRSDGRMGIGYNGTTYGRTINLGGTGINFYTSNEAAFGGAIFPTDTSLILWSNSNANNYLVFQPSWGNTGIGTYTPNAKFHLNGAQLIGNNSARIATGYSLSVDGKIMCEQIDVANSTTWPDYVFEDNYPLLPIYELEQKLRKEKHLPNVPSAVEIDRNGINLGRMSAALLEKVEEQSLYIIQLKKENDNLEARFRALEKKVADMIAGKN